MWLYLALACLSVVAAQTPQNLQQKTCSSSGQRAVIQNGSPAMIGGLMAMHHAGSGGYGCGSISTGMMQAYEAIRWALDRLNKKDQILNGEYLNNSYIPGVNLGMTVYDYCDRSSSAIASAQELYPQFSAEARDCTKNSSSVMLGLVGASSSSVTKDVNEFSSQFNIPLVSYMATAAELSDGAMYPNFMRTVPPDGPLMDAIISVMNELGWQYVVVVYTEDTFGRGAFNELRPKLVAAGKCLTLAIGTGADDTSEAAMNQVLGKALATETTGVIFFGGSDIALKLLDVAENYQNAGKLQWIFTDSIPLASTFTGKKYPRGIISVLSGSRKIIEFEDHWVRINVNNPSAENPWYQDWYQTEYNCRLPSSSNPAFNGLPTCPTLTETQRRNEFVQDQFVEPAVHAVFGYAYALRSAHSDKCGGVAGLCSQLASMTTQEFYNNYLRNISFTYTKGERVESLASVGLEPYNAAAKVRFDANGDIVDPTYDVYNFNDYPGGAAYKFRKLGSYLNGRLEIVTSRLWMYDEARNDRVTPLPSSPCPASGCRPCLGVPTQSPYMYVPGDIVINGLFSLHFQGMAPLSCGLFDNGMRPGVQYMEAMFYAINRINTYFRAIDSTFLRGVSLGGLAFDDCMDASLGSHLVTENKKPLMGYAATSSELEDYEYYRYMLLGNKELLKALVLMIKRLGWHYVQVVQSPGGYFDTMYTDFRTIAAEEGICVVANHMFMEKGDMAHVIEKLKGHSSVKPVVLLANVNHIKSFLMKVDEMNVEGHFHYLLTMGKTEESAYQGLGNVTNGLLTVDIPGPDVTGFRQYLEGLRPTQYMTNPWFNEWYEIAMNCSLDASNMRSFGVVCNDPVNTPITTKVDVMRAVFPAIFGVYALSTALHETLLHYCGSTYNGICADFMNAADKGKIMLDKIDNTVMNYNGVSFMFKDKMVNFPVSFYNYGGGSFNLIGDYRFSDSRFTLSTSLIRLYGNLEPSAVTPHCTSVCTECLYAFSHQEYIYEEGDLIIPAMFDVHYPGSLPFLCGNLRFRNGFMNTEAFLFALDRINNGRANFTLNNVKLGLLGFDGCMDNDRALTITAGLYAGIFPLEDGKFEIPMDRLLGWVPYADDFTINIASSNLLNLITPAATSPILDDKSRYTTFFRTIASDGLRALAMAKTSALMGYKYIITLNAPDRGSRDALAAFKKYMEDEGICIGASYEFDTDWHSGTVGQLHRCFKYQSRSSIQ
ncbi:hypothetical protein FSP39_012853 [Pinctada imbricata]|uniref:Receptor ligand binding region domain-containing protein n=1 Tax=Pinctada imbricata TaxID=66713 RepID=A0AA89BM66_PINIB|nr:hypothetical protein FSP39_012853 [Pinctada imbricata]